MTNKLHKMYLQHDCIHMKVEHDKPASNRSCPRRILDTGSGSHWRRCPLRRLVVGAGECHQRQKRVPLDCKGHLEKYSVQVLLSNTCRCSTIPKCFAPIMLHNITELINLKIVQLQF